MNRFRPTRGTKKHLRGISRSPSGSSSIQQKINRRIRLRLLKWLADGKLHEDYSSMDALASDINVSREQLSFYCSTMLHKRFATWRKELRIEEAKYLLLEYPDLPANAVGAMVGIPDKSNFRRQFLETTGCTPNEWRAACFGIRK